MDPTQSSSLPTCAQCGEVMIAARLYEPLAGAAGPLHRADTLPIMIWRCENCGHVQPRTASITPSDRPLLRSSAYTHH